MRLSPFPILASFPLLTLQVCDAGPGTVGGAGRAAKVARLCETRVPFAPDPPAAVPEPRIDRAYFDAGNRLCWDDRKVHEQATGDCDAPPRPPYPRRTWLLDPRVDERRCADATRRGRTRKTLVGLDADGRVRWQRALAFRSGDTDIEQWLIGATPEGLVLSNLEVWSPASGETLVPARTHPAGPDGRPVPDYQFSTTALYIPQSKELLVFEAEVTLVRREGGLYRINPETGRKELWIEVSATFFGTYDRVESMALSRDGRYVLLGLRQAVRGPSYVSVGVLDLETHERVYGERHGEGHACSAPQVVAGVDRNFGFAYRDENAREHVLVNYTTLP